MKWLRVLVLTETSDSSLKIEKWCEFCEDYGCDIDHYPESHGTTWYVCHEKGKDETGSGLSVDRPTTYIAALREAAPSGDVIYIIRDKSNAIQSI
jgi:hypothetical protein